jgi:hypothetical protein
MLKNVYTLFFAVALMFATTIVSAQSTAGPIQINSVADSTNVTAGDNFARLFFRGETINIQGAYGDVAMAKSGYVTYQVFAADWSSTVYDVPQVFLDVDSAIGTANGVIDVDFTFANDAPYFGQHHDSTDVNDIKTAFYFIQARVVYDPINDTFWNLFVEVSEGAVGTKRITPMLTSLEVFPNPAANQVRIETDDNNAEKSVQVFDMTGKLVLEKTMTGNMLDISHLNTGFHVIRVEQNGKVGGQKLMVK